MFSKIRKILAFLSLVVSPFFVLSNVYFAHEAYKIYELNWGRLEPTKYLLFLKSLNNALTGRILSLMNLNNRAGSLQTWKLLPVANHTEYFDLGYVRLFYWYGILTASIIIIAYSLLLIYFYKSNKYNNTILLTIIFFYTLFEAHFVSVYIGRNYHLFIFGAAIFSIINPKKKGA